MPKPTNIVATTFYGPPGAHIGNVLLTRSTAARALRQWRRLRQSGREHCVFGRSFGRLVATRSTWERRYSLLNTGNRPLVVMSIRL